MDFISIFEKFGLPIAFLAVMVWLYLRTDDKAEKIQENHKEERREWRHGQEKLQNDTNHALRELTKVIIKIESKK